uniref:Uncharacterized protein n=1 Tax=Amorphochlora amoebiformis TaxID=1561963 RepID=A0A0H5BHS9_9EUKA|nr:hypothetical protein [Amorphochlora amoebiformis]
MLTSLNMLPSKSSCGWIIVVENYNYQIINKIIKYLKFSYTNLAIDMIKMEYSLNKYSNLIFLSIPDLKTANFLRILLEKTFNCSKGINIYWGFMRED